MLRDYMLLERNTYLIRLRIEAFTPERLEASQCYPRTVFWMLADRS